MRTLRAPLMLASILLIPAYVAQQNPNFARTQSDKASPRIPADQMASRELNFAYYMIRDGFHSKLFLVSDSPKPMQFVVVVHNLAGEAVEGPPMAIQPEQKLSLDVGDFLDRASAHGASEFSEGSVAVHYHGDSMGLVGQVTITNPALHLSFDSLMAMAPMAGPILMPNTAPAMTVPTGELNAVWWGIGGAREARFAVSNSGDASAGANVFLDFGGVRHASATLNFLPHETKVVRLVQLLADLKVSPSEATEGGFTVVPSSPNPTLIATGYIIDPSTGFSTTLHFLPPDAQIASVLHATGVPIGIPTEDSPFGGEGNFTPHVVVRNLQDSPQSVAITIQYDSGEGPEQVALPPLAISSHTTRDISLAPVPVELPPVPYCSIRIEYSGLPGSVIGEVSSVEVIEDLAIDSRLANEGDGRAGSGANPWHLDDQTESIVFLTNMGDEPCDIGFQIVAGGIHYYVTDLSLKPHETRAINLRELRDAQRPDLLGNRIPAEAEDGVAMWNRLSDVPVMGRLMVLQPANRTASSFDCCYCVCANQYDHLDIVLPGTTPVLTTFNVLAGDKRQLAARAAFLDCHGNPSYTYPTSTSTWSSGDSTIATVDNGTSKGLATGVKGGVTTITASYAHQTCASSTPCNCYTLTNDAFSDAHVQIPKSLSVNSVTTIATNTTGGVCVTGTDFGIQVATTYQVLDQNTPPNAIQSSSMEPQEQLLKVVFCAPTCGPPVDIEPTWQDIGPTKISGTSKYTSSTGTFIDAPFGTCANAAFTQTETQPISILVGSTRYSVRTNNITLSSSSSGHGSITNGSDISKSR